MTDKVKVIADGKDSYRVEYRNGKKTCVFMTEDGREVLFQRNKQGYVVKINDIAAECFTLCAARKLSIPEFENPYIEKGPKHSIKIVPSVQVESKKPTWLDPRSAAAHNNTILTHKDD